ncbi:hypothetical protein T07_1180 [Trichinella nelsoni]|uniref:Uncharacterized protein n=1 Tax=Trichinella nelsoni TaxID=6336 RepID=A0A0V0SFA4_9BILA|nr:hypothetical protein T07_1180 [Trichinella nelsoni]
MGCLWIAIFYCSVTDSFTFHGPAVDVIAWLICFEEQEKQFHFKDSSNQYDLAPQWSSANDESVDLIFITDASSYH